MSLSWVWQPHLGEPYTRASYCSHKTHKTCLINLTIIKIPISQGISLNTINEFTNQTKQTQLSNLKTKPFSNNNFHKHPSYNYRLGRIMLPWAVDLW